MRAVIGGAAGILALVSASCGSAEPGLPEPAPPEWTSWSELPSLPDPVGLAGAFVGVVGDRLVVAGGANFPEGRPWEKGPKLWHDSVFVLDAPDGAWTREARLPAPSAYGVSVSEGDRAIFAGGGDGLRHHDAVWSVQIEDDTLSLEALPPLPCPSAFCAGARVGELLYVAGGLDAPDASECLHRAWSLDLADPSATWQELPPWPGPPRMLAVGGRHDGGFALIGGVELVPDGRGGVRREYLQDALLYREDAGWSSLPQLPVPTAAAPSPAWTLDDGSMVVVGGDDGDLADTPLAELRDLHPGFRGRVQALATGAAQWTLEGRFPKDVGPDPAGRPEEGVWPPVTTGTATWRGMYVIPTGEARPGVRTARVFGVTDEG